MIPKEDKELIIKSRIYNAEAHKLNLELDIVQEQSKANPEDQIVTKLQAEIQDVESQISALNNILNAL